MGATGGVAHVLRSQVEGYVLSSPVVARAAVARATHLEAQTCQNVSAKRSSLVSGRRCCHRLSHMICPLVLERRVSRQAAPSQMHHTLRINSLASCVALCRALARKQHELYAVCCPLRQLKPEHTSTHQPFTSPHTCARPRASTEPLRLAPAANPRWPPVGPPNLAGCVAGGGRACLVTMPL